MRFATPIAFFLLLFMPLMLESSVLQKLKLRLGIGRDKVRAAFALPFSSPIEISSLPRSLRSRLRDPLLSLLRVTAFLLLVIAFARPQTGTEFVETEASGRDIILALDTSGSMAALDFTLDGKRVNRLEALKSVVKEFIDARPADRIGLIVFGENAFTQCPLTLDHRVLKEFIDALEVGMAGQGTAIGDAMAVSLKRIKDIPADSKVLILVTDGKSNAGTLTPAESAEIAKRLNVKVHTIGIGQDGPAPFPAQGMFGQTTLVNRRLEFDEKTLIQIALSTGGQYFHADNTDGLRNIYQALDKLEERNEKTFQHIEYEEHFMTPLLFAFVALISIEILSLSFFFAVP